MASSPTKEVGITNNQTIPNNLLDGVDLSTDIDSLLTNEEGGSKVHLAVDINSRFTTPEEDEEIETQKECEKMEKEKQEPEANTENQLDLIKKVDERLTTCRFSRKLLSMNSIGVPLEDLPSPKSHHCTSSIPRRLSLGAALEPVNIVPVLPSPADTHPNEAEIRRVMQYDQTMQSNKTNEFVVDIPHGRGASAFEGSPLYGDEDLTARQYVYPPFRYTSV
jgi:hypothetical protein